MGQLGNYIHYRVINYKNAGINHKGQKKGNTTATKALSEQHQHIKDRIKNLDDRKEEIKLINSKLNKLYESVQNPDSVTYKSLIKQMEKDYASKLGNIDIQNLAVYSNEGLKAKHSQVLSKLDISKNQYAIMKSTLDKRLIQIKNIMQTLPESATKAELQKKVAESEMIIKTLKQVNQQERLHLKQSGVAYSISQNAEELQRISFLLNDCAALLAPSTLALQQGDLFEYLLALLPAFFQKKADDVANQEVAKKLFKNKVGGDRTDKIQINVDFNEGFIDKSVFSLQGYSETEPGVFMHSGSQDKIDVEFIWNNLVYPISAKNTKSLSDVKVVSSQSLLYLMQGEKTNFLNHFLNLTADHPEDHQGSKYLPSQSTINRYKQMMQTTILSKVISGQTFGKTRIAEILVVNDAKTGKYYVFSIKKILKKIVNNAYNQSIGKTEMVEEVKTEGGGKVTTHTKVTGSYNFRNDWTDSGAPTRIAKLLMDVHKQKISAAINIKKI